VEYATNACVREGSNPIVSIGITLPDGGDTVLIMATISSPPHSSSSVSSLSAVQTTPSDGGGGIGGEVTEDELNQLTEPEFNPLVKEKHQRAQFRIVEVPLSASFSSSQHSTILVGLSGLISDATSLLQIIYSQLEQEQRSMGWHRLGLSPIGVNKIVDEIGHGSASTQATELYRRRHIIYQSIFAQPSETVLRLSRAIADECQKHAFGGGLRPFGASLLIAGVDGCPASHSTKSNTARSSILGARVSMCETYPNGGWRNCVSSNLQNNNSKSNDHTSSTTTSFQIMISGGSVQSQRSLKRMLSSRLHKSNYDGSDESLFLHQVLQTITISLVEEWQNRGSHSPSSTRRELLESMQECLTTAIPDMEIVLSSSKRGTHRLTEKDVSRLLRFEWSRKVCSNECP